MSTPLRVAAFVTALAAAFALAWGGGQLFGPIDTELAAQEDDAGHGVTVPTDPRSPRPPASPPAPTASRWRWPTGRWRRAAPGSTSRS